MSTRSSTRPCSSITVAVAVVVVVVMVVAIWGCTIIGDPKIDPNSRIPLYSRPQSLLHLGAGSAAPCCVASGAHAAASIPNAPSNVAPEP